RSVLILGDDPFPTETFRFAIGGLPVADETSRHEDRNAPAPEDLLEGSAPLAQRKRHERSPVVLEEVEDRVPRRSSYDSPASLQQLKPGDALGAQRHESA